MYKNHSNRRLVMLTGATGFLGSHLATHLDASGFELVILKRRKSDVSRISTITDRIHSYDTDDDNFEYIFAQHDFDAVIHTATNYGRRGCAATDLVSDNVTFPLKLLQLAVAHKVRFFINTDTKQEKLLNYYTLSKNHFADWLLLFKNEIKIVNIKIEHMYGPFDNESSFVLWVIKQLFERVDRVALTHGRQKRDFVYISDVIEAYVRIFESLSEDSEMDEYEVGTGQSISIKDFVEIIVEVFEETIGIECHTKLNFGELPVRQFEPMELKADISKLVSLGWKPAMMLREGITETIRWYQHFRGKKV